MVGVAAVGHADVGVLAVEPGPYQQDPDLAGGASRPVDRGCPSRDQPLTGWSYSVILIGVKTAISVPDETFDRASQRAQQLGISRSEFFATAAKRYLEALDRESLTARIDQALDLVGDDPDTTMATDLGRARLAQDDW